MAKHKSKQRKIDTEKGKVTLLSSLYHLFTKTNKLLARTVIREAIPTFEKVTPETLHLLNPIMNEVNLIMNKTLQTVRFFSDISSD